MSNAHSRIGPSHGVLVMQCAGSVQAEDAVGRPPAGEAAIRGTALHQLAEACLRDHTKPTDPAIVLYVEAVRKTAMRADVAPLIEQRLNLSAYHPELFGTLDAAVIDLAWGTLSIFDFKSGFHHVPADALQLKIYGAMAFLSLPVADQHRIRVIDTVVVQELVREARHCVADIIDTLSAYVDQAWIATHSKNPPRTAGPWCRDHYCAARESCPAYREMAVREAQQEFTVVNEMEEQSH